MRRVIPILAVLGGCLWSTPPAEAQKAEEAPLRKIKTGRISVDFEELPLDQAVEHIRRLTGLDFRFDRSVPDPGSLRVSLKLEDVRIISVLKIVLGQHDLGAVYDEGVVVIKPKDRIDAEVETRVYDVRDLLLRIPDFPGPRIQLVEPRPGAEPGVVFLLESPEDAEPDGEAIVDILRTGVGEEDWSRSPHARIRLLDNGLLLVTQTRRVHRKIERLLGRLRHFR